MCLLLLSALAGRRGVKTLLTSASCCCVVLVPLQAQVLTLLLDVAAGMSYLHARNVLHVSCFSCMLQARSWR